MEVSRQRCKQLPPANRIRAFRDAVISWYPAGGRRFPWRGKSASRYRLVVTELLLQRTRAETIADFYLAFETEFPSWKQLAQADERRLRKFLKPIGLWRRRAATLRGLARAMSDRNGRFPRTRDMIELLPGVGQYIANAILLLVHGQEEPLLDVNMAKGCRTLFRTAPACRHSIRPLPSDARETGRSWPERQGAQLGCARSSSGHL